MKALKKRNKGHRSARSYALWLLGTRAYSAAKLQERMLAKGFAEAETCDAIAYLQEIGYLDDEAFARNYVESRMKAGNGPRKLRWELRRRGIESSLADEAIAHQADADWKQEITAICQRYMQRKGSLDAKGRQALLRYLLQRGYSYDMAQEAIGTILPALDNEA